VKRFFFLDTMERTMPAMVAAVEVNQVEVTEGTVRDVELMFGN
jgi:hypothetical protein